MFQFKLSRDYLDLKSKSPDFYFKISYKKGKEKIILFSGKKKSQDIEINLILSFMNPIIYIHQMILDNLIYF
jgi:hypothetical protein